MPVGRASKSEKAKRQRRLNITKAKAKALLAKRDAMHPVAVHIAEAVAEGHLEEVVIYPPAKPVPSVNKSWWHSFLEFWD